MKWENSKSVYGVTSASVLVLAVMLLLDSEAGCSRRQVGMARGAA
jgi:hypothetical protein